MKFCPICKTQYPEDANFCPQETCATSEGPQRLQFVPAQPVSRFSPVERIGGGNTGEVWKARDNQSGAEVAYKVVAPDVLPTQAAQARAEREFKQLMRVASPKIATIIDCEKTSTGGLAVAMELFHGDSLDRLLASGPMPFEKAKSIVGQVGLALLEAQKVGLVHRDVAPKNVLVSAAGDVKVINFPLAKPINDRIAGVADYLSPEQAQGKPVDQRSNTYSLAAIFYHLLTGEPPFQGATVQTVLDMQVSTPALPPTQRRPGAGLPPDADKLVLKAMDKSSSRRHLTLRLFLNELEALKDKPAPAGNLGREAGLAKTMMFGGNQADIARMVAEARAAKAAAAPAAPAVAQPVAFAPAPAPAARSFDVGQTMIAGGAPAHAAPHAQPLAARMPSPGIAPTPAPPAAHHQPTPAPFAPTPPPVAVPSRPAFAPAPAAPPSHPTPAQALQPTPGPAQPTPGPAQPTPGLAQPTPGLAQPAAGKAAEAGKSPQKAGSAFRETLWFKQGDVEQMVADAKAKMQAAGKAAAAEPADVNVDGRPLEDRYVDDGSVTIEDRKKFSLRTGGTATSIPTTGDKGPAEKVPGEKMDEKEMVGEISGGRRTLILVIAVVVILALGVVVAMMLKGKGQGSAVRTATTTQTLVASPHPTPLPGGSPPGQQVGDAGVGAGAPPGKTAATTAGSAVGNAGGTTKPAVGGTTGEAKAVSVAKKPAAAKKKPAVVKHPAPKKKR
jgi:eukaryotic-like serine/threonine-protein kinase